MKKITLCVDCCKHCPVAIPVREGTIFKKTVYYCMYYSAKDTMQPISVMNANTIPEWCPLKETTKEEDEQSIIKEVVVY